MKTKNKQLVSLKHDIMFKSIFGDLEHLEFLTALISSILNVPYEKIEGNVSLTSNEIPIDKKEEKAFRVDILAIYGNKFIDIEMNYHALNSERNLAYLCSVFGRQFVRGKDYEEIKDCVLVNFNNFDDSDAVETYFLKGEKSGKILTYSFRIVDVSLVKCKNIDYNKVNKDENLKKWGLLMNTDKLEEFKEILNTIEMPEKVKNNLLERVIDLSSNNDVLNIVSKEEYYEYKVNKELEKKDTLLEEKDTLLEEKDTLLKIQEQKMLETAKKLKNSNVDIDTIVNATGMSKEEIENL